MGVLVYLLRLIIGLLLLQSSPLWATVSSSAGPQLQARINLAYSQILRTRMGKSICANILGADSTAIAFHLGIDADTAKKLAPDCMGANGSAWIVPTAFQDISKLTVVPYEARRYFVDQTPPGAPIESWTEPFKNSTTFFTSDGALTDSRLVQLLAHEMAVYFDGKANPAHPDALRLESMRDLKIVPEVGMLPLVVMSDPLVAHTLTFVRALQVEYAIVDEMVAAGVIAAPEDNADPYLRFLISDQCQQSCLYSLIENMRLSYLPIALPLLAYAPHFRSLLAPELIRLNPKWSAEQWSRYQHAINQYPVEFLKGMPADERLAEGLQSMFSITTQRQGTFLEVMLFVRDDLWELERPVLQNAKTQTGETLLEFMKRPLLSGYNIMLSSGPRVRVRTGSVE